MNSSPLRAVAKLGVQQQLALAVLLSVSLAALAVRATLFVFSQQRSYRDTVRRSTEKIGISPSALQALASYRWPGNVHELENAIARAVALSTSQVLGPLELVVKTDARETDRKTVRLP